MKECKFLFIIFALISIASSLILKDPLDPFNQNKNNLKFLDENGSSPLLFDQKLDHFNQQENSTFKQRYWINDDYIVKDSKSTPLFLYVCGEWTCSYPSENNYVVLLAKKYKGILVIHEHRYYGESQPKEDWKTENLKWLNTDQALADLAHFTKSMNREFVKKYNIPEDRRWILIGGSYPGALVSWFRGKFPHIALGAWSSSGVVNAIEDYHQFDETVSYALDKTPNCRQAVQNLVDYTNKEFEDPEKGKKIKEQWESLDIPDDEFFWYYSDIIAETVQYGGRTSFCKRTINMGTQYEEMNKVLYSEKGKADKKMYPSKVLQDTTIDFSKNARQWTYQYCSQLGYMQTLSKTYPPLKNKNMTINFYYKYCKDIFGIDIKPRTELWNERYGADNPSISKVIYMNGDEDPWKSSSILKSNDPLIYTFEMKCNDCAHCVDLHNTTEPVVLAARAKAERIVQQWLDIELLGESLGFKAGRLENFVNDQLINSIEKLQ